MKTPVLSKEIAEQMLMNAFAACRQEPNKVPLEELSAYSAYRTERYTLQRTVIIIVLLLFLLLPVLFVTTGLTVNSHISAATGNPVFEVYASGRIPVTQINAVIDGQSVPVTEIASHAYLIRPNINGEMTVTVDLLNRQHASVTVPVKGVDTEGPTLTGTENAGLFLHLYFADAGSGIDPDAFRITDDDGNEYPVYGWDGETGRLTLKYPSTALSVLAADRNGNTLNIRLNLAEEKDNAETEESVSIGVRTGKTE